MWLLISFVSAYSSTETISSDSLFTSLQDFGFEKNGTFSFRLFSSSKFTTAIYLIPELKYSSLDFSKTSSQRYCKYLDKNLLKFSSTQYYYHLQGKIFHNWSGYINKSEILIPVIANCQMKSITISYVFRNPKTNLDSREKILPLFNIIMCLLSTTLTIFWIANSIIHPKFMIQLHILFSISTILMALSYYYKADVWFSRAIIDSTTPNNQTISFLVEILSIAFLFTINACASTGYGIYYDDIRYAIFNFLRVYILSITILITKGLIETLNYTWIYLILDLLAVMMGFSYAEFIAQKIQSAYILKTELTERYDQYSRKFDLVIDFSSDLLVYLMGLFITVIYVMISSFHKTVSIFIQDMFIFTLLFMDIHYFFYKEEYNGTNEQIEERPQIQSDLILLNDPDKTDYVFVSHIMP